MLEYIVQSLLQLVAATDCSDKCTTFSIPAAVAAVITKTAVVMVLLHLYLSHSFFLHLTSGLKLTSATNPPHHRHLVLVGLPFTDFMAVSCFSHA